MVGSARLLSSNKKRVFEENVEVESSQVIKIETCGDLQAMTVQQLRTMSKQVRISARGSKHELVSALKCFLDNEKDAQNIPMTSKMGTDDLKNTTSTSDAVKSSGKKAKQLTSGDKAQNLNLVAEVLTVQQRKTRGKPPTDDNANSVVDSENLKTATKPSPTKRKGSSQVEKEDGASTERVGFFQSSSEPWTILAHKKPQQGWIPYNPKTMRPPPLDDGTKFVKLISWNVNGLRALLKLDSFSAFAQREDFDILCLQETKLQERDVEKIKECLLDGYDNSFWTCSVSKLGYSGTAIISRVKPISVRYGLGILDHDSEGRLVTLEFDTFYLISGYVPNSGDGLKRLTYRVTQWDPSLANYMKELEKSKPVILTGDLNCVHQEIDIFNPAYGKTDAINSKHIYSRPLSSVVDIISEYQCDKPHDNEKAMEKDAALRFAISQVASEFGKESMLSLQRFFGLRYSPIVSTGSLKLDLALGVGGLPKGRIVEIYGPESSGKTTLAFHIIKEAQKNGGYCAFLDAENALDPLLAESSGVNTDNLLIARPNSAENLLSIAHTLARSGAVEVIVVDSVAALASQRELDVGIDGHCREVQSRLMTQALRKISSTLCQSKTLLVFLNQVRTRPPKGFGRGTEITCGGNALEFYSAVRMKIARKGLIQKEDEIAGLSVCVQIVKNKLAPVMTNADLEIIYGRGFAYEAEVLEMACQQGVISKRESGYCIEGEILKDKYEAERYLAEYHEIRETVVKILRSQLFDKR
ncbi:hypothetical protein AQUCO_00600197v1 [Aquilegia coerulea]|uniref:DNA-(apurinic or apyrimidinic site) endonuclease n=2 Tax=Aquilegia coerulea TaxID=218851 RepID=A0A2G5ENM1_AQUCA|nr:hypothetical protein AQUCO_00600197v1 [Aquilegia coerulea]